jgi:hypothetical protein
LALLASSAVRPIIITAGADQAFSDLPETTRASVQAYARRFLADLRPQLKRSANELGYDCLAAVALERAGVTGGTARALRSVADLQASAMLRRGGALAWRATSNAAQEAKCGPGGWESFGVCNGPDTAYGFQSGLAIACLSETGALTHDDSLLALAKRSFHYWDLFRGPVPGCSGCLYYWESDKPAAKNRYVRNLSLFLGFAAASVALRTGDKELASVAHEVVKSDIWEESKGNHGYLGRLDPLSKRPGEAERIENHAAAVSLLLEGIGRAVDMPGARAAGLAVWKEWATCSNKQCLANNCSYWGADPSRCAVTVTPTHCAFRARDKLADTMCLAALDNAKSLSPFAILAVIMGGTHKH